MPRAAVDLHCHILPGLDDGAADIADAVDMVRQAEADGLQAICATPHIRHDHDVRIAELADRRAALSRELAAHGCSTEILQGAEVAASALPGLSDDELHAVTLGGGGRWVLLEPQPGPLETAFEAAVDSLAERGFRALVAHPERHSSPELIDRLRRLIDKGCLVQATAAFFIEEGSASGMLQLARSGVVHVLGSDAHSSRAGRPVALSAALGALAQVRPVSEHLEWIGATAPRGIVRGELLTPPF